MARNTRAEFIVAANKLSAAYLANAADLPGLGPLHGEFAVLLNELTDLGVLQDAQTAAVQQTSKEIDTRLTLGRILATRLRNGVKLHFGTRTEKVVEFGIRPFRKAARPVKVVAKEASAKSPKAETTTPAA